MVLGYKADAIISLLVYKMNLIESFRRINQVNQNRSIKKQDPIGLASFDENMPIFTGFWNPDSTVHYASNPTPDLTEQHRSGGWVAGL